MAETPADASNSSSISISEVAVKSKKLITLISYDGERFDVMEEVASTSETIKHMIEDDCTDNGIPLPNVPAKVLCKVIEYCNKHAAVIAGGGSEKEEDLKSFDAQFVAVDKDTLFQLILSANYLSIEGLLNLTCQTVADSIKGMPVDEIRKTFNLENDFTPEEEAHLRSENAWAFQFQ